MFASAALLALGGCVDPPISVDPDIGGHRVQATFSAWEWHDPTVCQRLHASLAALYESEVFECDAYGVQVRPPHGQPFTAYDLVVSLPGEVARSRDYPTDLVDPIELALIGRTKPFRGVIAYNLLATAEGEKVPVIAHIWSSRDWARYRAAVVTP